MRDHCHDPFVFQESSGIGFGTKDLRFADGCGQRMSALAGKVSLMYLP
jgi:hypothetical protein